uniref:CUB domain-containing protein n=1 Tax=Arion vulgaris TaxID=1028688 RepID=A0A0B7A019_9EUPU
MTQGYFISILLLIVTFIWKSVLGNTMSACFSANKSLDIDCGDGHMVQITKTFYGYSPTGQCQLVAEEAGAGCTTDDQAHYPCVGQRLCSINLPTGQFGVNVPACSQRSNYFQVEYTCVLAISVSNICQNNQLTAQSGYIMTPRYPANYNTQGDCATTIVVHPTQKLDLYIIDMDLEARGKKDCADLLYFNDKLRSITLCGQRTNTSYNMHSNYLHIELRSSGAGLSKGFWLYYEAVPPLPTSLLPPVTVEKSTSTKPVEQNGQTDENSELTENANKGSDSIIMTTLSYKDSKSTVPLYRNVSRQQLPFAAIAGGVIGTLSIILFILLILLFIKWYKERKYYKAEKILEIRNPAFRSSSDFQEIPQPNNGFYC